MRKQKGFSLIELLIVMAIIMTLAAVAIPTLLRARVAANQASAVASVKTILTANVNYHSIFGGYAPSLAALGGDISSCSEVHAAPVMTSACLIDTGLSSADNADSAKSGYFFTYTGNLQSPNGTFQAFNVIASPAVANSTGDLAYYADGFSWSVNSIPAGTIGASSGAPKPPEAP